jgi:hypothetical protein
VGITGGHGARFCTPACEAGLAGPPARQRSVAVGLPVQRRAGRPGEVLGQPLGSGRQLRPASWVIGKFYGHSCIERSGHPARFTHSPRSHARGLQMSGYWSFSGRVSVSEVGGSTAQEPVDVLHDPLDRQQQSAPVGKFPDPVPWMLYGLARGLAGEKDWRALSPTLTDSRPLLDAHLAVAALHADLADI